MCFWLLCILYLWFLFFASFVNWWCSIVKFFGSLLFILCLSNQDFFVLWLSCRLHKVSLDIIVYFKFPSKLTSVTLHVLTLPFLWYMYLFVLRISTLGFPILIPLSLLVIKTVFWSPWPIMKVTVTGTQPIASCTTKTKVCMPLNQW